MLAEVGLEESSNKRHHIGFVRCHRLPHRLSLEALGNWQTFPFVLCTAMLPLGDLLAYDAVQLFLVGIFIGIGLERPVFWFINRGRPKTGEIRIT